MVLPIDSYENQITLALAANQAIIIAAETGAGKSTKVPLMLLAAGYGDAGMIGVTQPRRVAAMSVSEWVARLHGCELGGVIGYQIKAERQVSGDTKVKFMTEGILLRELHGDPMLRRYSVLVVDEAHERGINQDLLIALLKGLMARRPDLKVVIMSATISEERFSEHLGGAPIIKVPGRVFPVDVSYADRTPDTLKDMVRAVAETVTGLVLREDGDILAFLPDEATIKAACGQLDKLTGVRILPLYGAQDPAEQRTVFVRNETRRVILATNIAETSLTIDGVRHVVDTGLIKSVQYVNASMSALTIVDHSRAGCDQRKGRAGRTAEGVCHRLFSRYDFESRAAFTKPEILRTSLDQVLLHLRVLGYSTQEVLALPFMDPPGDARWREAEERLQMLGAVDGDGNVTEDGRRLQRLPVAPMLGRMLLSASAYGCVSQAATVVAGLTSRSLFIRPRGKEADADAAHGRFKMSGSDALALRAACTAWIQQKCSSRWARENFLSTKALDEIARNREHILEALDREGISITSTEDATGIKKAIAAGLIINLCVSSGRHGYLWHGREVFVHPGSAAFGAYGRFLVCTEVVQTSKAFARGCTPVEEAWLEEILPEKALTVTCRLERELFGIQVRLMRNMAWQGVRLRQAEVSLPTETDLRHAAEGIADDVVGYNDAHPSTAMLRHGWKTLLRLKGMSEHVRPEDSPDVRGLRDRFAAHVFGQIQNARSISDILNVRIIFPFIDLLTEQERAAYDASMRQADEARARAIAEEERQRAKGAARIAPLIAQIDALREEARGYPGIPDATIWKLEDARRWLSLTYPRVDDAIVAVGEARASVEFMRGRYVREIEQTASAHAQALALVPDCPVCGAAWSFDGQEARCGGDHDPRRFIQPAGRASNVFGRIVTDRNDAVATVTLQGTSVVFCFVRTAGLPWTGRTFSSVEYQTELAVLPVELTGRREQILSDLDELRCAREELAALTERVRDVERQVRSGSVRRLTFRIDGGRALADDGGRVYAAEYGNVYPNNGETWFCAVPSHSNRAIAEVCPLLKAGAISGQEDLSELQELVRSSYPGLPEILFN